MIIIIIIVNIIIMSIKIIFNLWISVVFENWIELHIYKWSVVFEIEMLYFGQLSGYICECLYKVVVVDIAHLQSQ